MSKNDEQKESPKHTQFYIKDIQFTELNNHVGWTLEQVQHSFTDSQFNYLRMPLVEQELLILPIIIKPEVR
jgi:hypothetical protein